MTEKTTSAFGMSYRVEQRAYPPRMGPRIAWSVRSGVTAGVLIAAAVVAGGVGAAAIAPALDAVAREPIGRPDLAPLLLGHVILYFAALATAAAGAFLSLARWIQRVPHQPLLLEMVLFAVGLAVAGSIALVNPAARALWGVDVWTIGDPKIWTAIAAAGVSLVVLGPAAAISRWRLSPGPHHTMLACAFAAVALALIAGAALGGGQHP